MSTVIHLIAVARMVDSSALSSSLDSLIAFLLHRNCGYRASLCFLYRRK